MEIIIATLLALVLVAVGLLAGFIVYDRADRQRVKTILVGAEDDLQTLLKQVKESHNTLTEADRLFDAKLVELGLKISQLQGNSKPAMRPFPGM